MDKTLSTNRGFRKGFTLIELLVSIVIFIIFLGIVSTSYVSIVRTQKHANDVRKLYSDLRTFIQAVTEDIRLSSIDYDCYEGKVDFIGGVLNTCGEGVVDSLGQGKSNYLSLTKKDGLEKIVYKYDFVGKKIMVQKWLKDGLNWVSEPGFESYVSVLSDAVEISNFSFGIFPEKNPYSEDYKIYSNNATQFQPSVTILMTAKNAAGVSTNFHFDFQTTISSRVYSRNQ